MRHRLPGRANRCLKREARSCKLPGMNLDTRIKYRHLLCFLEIARQGSLARAADVLAISQPAISKTLRELEELLETRLFERTRQGVELTAAGTLFMRYAGPSVHALREGVGSVRGEARAPSQVRIGVLSTVESLLMPEVLCRLHQRHSALVIEVVTGASAQLLGQLRLGELELVVGRMTDSPQIQGLSFEHLYSESMSLVVRPGHPLLARHPSNARGLATTRWSCRPRARPSASTPTACSCSARSRCQPSAWRPCPWP